jgi:hypothetical protein
MSNGWSDREHGALEMCTSLAALRGGVIHPENGGSIGGGQGRVLGSVESVRESETLSGSNMTDRMGQGSMLGGGAFTSGMAVNNIAYDVDSSGSDDGEWMS